MPSAFLFSRMEKRALPFAFGFLGRGERLALEFLCLCPSLVERGGEPCPLPSYPRKGEGVSGEPCLLPSSSRERRRERLVIFLPTLGRRGREERTWNSVFLIQREEERALLGSLLVIRREKGIVGRGSLGGGQRAKLSPPPLRLGMPPRARLALLYFSSEEDKILALGLPLPGKGVKSIALALCLPFLEKSGEPFL